MNTQSILDVLKECNFDYELTEDTWREKIADFLPKEIYINCNFDFGASKVVITPKGAPYVIKIPFNGCYDIEEFYDEEADEWYYTEDSEFRPFSNSLFGNWDYCYTEMVLYHKAKKADVHKFFAKPRCIGKINGHPIYIQERAEVYCRDENSPSKNQEKRNGTMNYCAEKNIHYFSPDWQTDVLYKYGEKMFDKLMTFIKDNKIVDLHRGNLGYVDGRPVIIDYAGWFE